MTTLTLQIKSNLDRFAAAWKTNDGSSVASWFTEDGSLINPFGQRADGRSAVAAMYSEYFGTILRGTSTTFDATRIRAIDDNHAFADAEQTISGPDGKVVLAVHLGALLRREGDTWRFVDARPYAYATPPG